jgi:hypothetical protein
VSEPAFHRGLWVLLGAGLTVRLALAFSTYGVAFDIDSFRIVHGALGEDPLHFYSETGRWPYPPGFLPLIESLSVLERASGLPFHGLIQLPSILADLAIAWLVQAYLALRGAGERMRLAAASLVAAGPIFVLVSGYHGQIDSVAILPAVAALYLWERPGTPRRAILCGVLIGLGAAVKSVPLLMALALLPNARSWREGAVLAGAALAVPVATLLPFAISDPDGVRAVASYRGWLGVGGYGLAVQPDLANFFLQDGSYDLNSASRFLHEQGPRLTLLGPALLSIVLFRHPGSAAGNAVLIWLTVYVFSPNFFFQYAVWGLPFFLMAGYLAQAAAAQLLLVVPAAVLYASLVDPFESGWITPPYVVWMLMVVLLAAVWLATLVRRRLAGVLPAGEAGGAASVALR